MNDIEKLIAELCPNGVEWKKLGEVCMFKRGQSLTSKNAVAGDVPVISGGQKPAFMHNIANRDGETIVIAGSGAYAGFVSYWKQPIFVSDAFSVDIIDSRELSTRYVFHFLLNNQQKIYATKTGAGIPHVYGRNISKFKLPLPPLPVQEKIVEILDKFTDYVTELTRELTRELTSRQKQYSFYRDKLLSFEDDVYQVEWKTLGEVVLFRRGSFPQPYGNADWYGGEGSQPFVQVADVSDSGYRLNSKTKQRISQKAMPKSIFVSSGTVVVTLQGTIGRVAITQYDSYVDRTLAIFEDYLIDINKKYFAYILKWKFDIEKENARGSTLKTITKEEFSQFQIPLPPLPVQEKIVQVLDNFDTVCNDLNIGLPKEIELRQKQYEYFRDKLLTFTAEGVYTDSTVQYRQDLIRLLQWVFGPIRVRLGSVINLSRGKRLTRSQLKEDGEYPVYQNSLKPLGYYQEFNRSAGTTFVICAGAAGEISYSSSNFWAADDVFTLETTTFISNSFMYYTLLNIQGRIKDKVRKASIPRLSKTVLENIVFTLPSFTEQQRIVSILDKFDTLTSDLSQGLPKEIDLRQKQYESIRDTLLNFN